MSVLKIKSKDFEMELSMDGNGVTELQSNGGAATTTDTRLEMALIALALNEYGESFIHDEETDVITIVNTQTEWKSKSFGLNNRGINIKK
jgi:hypothetical protein